MHVLRGVEDQKAFDKGLNNSTTARALLVLFERLARHTAVDAKSDAAMIAILKRQAFNDAIPAGLPPGTPVAHKTGNITQDPPRRGHRLRRRGRTCVVVLVRGIQDQKESAALMATLSRAIYESVRYRSARAVGELGRDVLIGVVRADRLQQRLDRNRPAGEREIGTIEERDQRLRRSIGIAADGVIHRLGQIGFAAAPASPQRVDRRRRAREGRVGRGGIAGRELRRRRGRRACARARETAPARGETPRPPATDRSRAGTRIRPRRARSSRTLRAYSCQDPDASSR